MSRLPAALVGLLALSAVSLAGCTTTHVHIFGAFRYDLIRDCLESPAGVDVIDGPDPGTCPKTLRCWFAPEGLVYVTDAACDAPLNFHDHTADLDGPCMKALAAYGRDGHAECTPGDGGA